MSAGKNLMAVPTIIVLLLFAYLALNLKTNSTKVIGAVVVEPGFNNIQPQINGRHYHTSGQYSMNLRSFSQEPMTITGISLADKATNRKCNTTLITRTDALGYKQTAGVKATCPRRSIDDVYVLSAEISYRLSGSDKLHQETGDIYGDVEL